ncbi:MAG TPA: hypothetical protein PKA28_07660 [Methylomusa anaerophila]|uniref:Uncharacterized protein n=1 Tax=Methylomusa anaerophila TaxID=1930071 RepID=A0A348AFW7_9FIRM|nr:hypothetical protein [Methylomusa anaerophila]BBB89965.1 hypothetical protein MAMMFC1_00606 [Methylomusa anaerophila]HML88308.1 hypothetical protein [Methylomusa anaerophila]
MIVIKSKNTILPDSPGKYKTLEEFYQDMRDYEEIIFEYDGKKYTAAYYDNKLSIAEFNKPDTEQIFESLEEFADNFVIGSIRFKDLVTKIDILVH